MDKEVSEWPKKFLPKVIQFDWMSKDGGKFAILVTYNRVPNEIEFHSKPYSYPLGETTKMGQLSEQIDSL